MPEFHGLGGSTAVEAAGRHPLKSKKGYSSRSLSGWVACELKSGRTSVHIKYMTNVGSLGVEIQ